MTARPIPFRAPMVRAILEGRKTMTRRVLRPRKGLTFGDVIDNGERVPGGFRCTRDQVEEPRYAVGDTLWVREAWRTLQKWDDLPPRHVMDDPDKVDFAANGFWRNPLWAWGRARAGIHMPRWASRIDLRVTGVRVERLQDISDDDVMAEGAVTWHDDGRLAHDRIADLTREQDQRDMLATYWGSLSGAFEALWNDIHGPDAWDENPWVAAIAFERMKP